MGQSIDSDSVGCNDGMPESKKRTFYFTMTGLKWDQRYICSKLGENMCKKNKEILFWKKEIAYTYKEIAYIKA